MIRYKIALLTLLPLFLLITWLPSVAQKSKSEGEITYAMQLSSPMFETYELKMDDLKMVLTFKNNIARKELKSDNPYFSSYPVISDGKTSINLINRMGKKVAVVHEVKKVPQQETDPALFRIPDEYEQITPEQYQQMIETTGGAPKER